MAAAIFATPSPLALLLLLLAVVLSAATGQGEGAVASNSSSEASARGIVDGTPNVAPASVDEPGLGKNASIASGDALQTAASADDRCSSQEIPLGSKCTGCPPMYDGKLCASTTWYEDRTKGSCGCGTKPMVEDDWWTLNSFTAALNTVSMDPQNPALTYCLSGCGSCYELCTTGGIIDSLDLSATPGQCTVFKITNRCADGWNEGWPDWCSQHLSWQDCQANPDKCRQEGGTNMFGYSAHFDLQDAHRQIQHTLGWVNPEVTFEPVSCDKWQGPADAECPGCNGGW